MKFKPQYIYLAVALFLGLISLIYLNGVVNSAREAERQAKVVNTKTILVASHNIAPGTTIQTSDVSAVEWPIKGLPKDATFSKPSELAGRVAKSEIYANEPIYENKLSGKGSRGGLSVMIPKGMRAITVAVSEVKGVAGFVKPGDHVDVLVTFADFTDKGGETQVTRTVLQNVLVIAAAQQSTSDEFKDKMADDSGSDVLIKSDKKKDKAPKAQLVSSITLALTPQETEKLALADESGELRLAMRGEMDYNSEKIKLSGFKSRQLLNNSTPSVAPVRRFTDGGSPVRVGRIVEVYDSGERSALRF